VCSEAQPRVFGVESMVAGRLPFLILSLPHRPLNIQKSSICGTSTACQLLCMRCQYSRYHCRGHPAGWSYPCRRLPLFTMTSVDLPQSEPIAYCLGAAGSGKRFSPTSPATLPCSSTTKAETATSIFTSQQQERLLRESCLVVRAAFRSFRSVQILHSVKSSTLSYAESSCDTAQMSNLELHLNRKSHRQESQIWSS
jgi:hypothetical protein